MGTPRHWFWQRPDEPPPLRVPRAVFVLRCGYLTLVVLLSLATYLAFVVERPPQNETDSVGAANQAQKLQLLTRLSNNLNHCNTLILDYLLVRSPNRNVKLDRRLDALGSNSSAIMEQLQVVDLPQDVLDDLKLQFQQYFKAVNTVRQSGGKWKPQHRGETLNSIGASAEAILQKIEAARKTLPPAGVSQAKVRQREFDQLFLLLLICVVTSTILGCTSIVYSRKAHLERRRKYEDAVRSEKELVQMSSRLLTVQENERKRLARELHDSIGQILTALRMEISYVERLGVTDDAGMYDRLARARALAEEAMGTVRNVSLLLRPTLLDDLGLEPALRWQTEDFTRRTHIRCEFHCSQLEGDLAEPYKVCVYRVLQESLHNIQKHALASNVEICVEQDGDRLLLVVEDNGCGFPIDDAGLPVQNTGLGLLGMRERAAMLGGRVRIDSALGRGTVVMMSLTLNKLSPSVDTSPGQEQLYANSDPLG